MQNDHPRTTDESEDLPDEEYVHLSLPFDQNRIITHIPEILEPINNSPLEGRRVRVFGGYFTQVNVLMETAISEIPDFIGIIVGEQRGRIMAYDGDNDYFIGWLSPDEYEYMPFNVEYNIKWLQ